MTKPGWLWDHYWSIRLPMVGASAVLAVMILLHSVDPAKPVEQTPPTTYASYASKLTHLERQGP